MRYWMWQQFDVDVNYFQDDEGIFKVLWNSLIVTRLCNWIRILDHNFGKVD